MDDEQNKPGTTQIPLINDLVFDDSLPLKAPPRKRKTGSRPTKPDKASIPPGYDPDTGDLFGELEDLAQDDAPLDDSDGTERSRELTRQLSLEIKDELEGLLQDLRQTD